jgi:hypothetical protein
MTDNVIHFPRPGTDEWITRGLCKSGLIAALERIPGDPIVSIKAPDIEGFETVGIKAVGFHDDEVVLYPVLALIEDETFQYDHLGTEVALYHPATALIEDENFQYDLFEAPES